MPTILCFLVVFTLAQLQPAGAQDRCGCQERLTQESRACPNDNRRRVCSDQALARYNGCIRACLPQTRPSTTTR